MSTDTKFPIKDDNFVTIIPLEKFTNLEDLLLAFEDLSLSKYLNKLVSNKVVEIKVLNKIYYVKNIVIAKWEAGYEFGWTVVAQPVDHSVNLNDPVCYTFEANAITYMKIIKSLLQK